MDFNAYTTDPLKTFYNTTLADARAKAEAARDVRDAIEAREPNYRGQSRTQLRGAVTSLYTARTFANNPHDLQADQNPYRTT